MPPRERFEPRAMVSVLLGSVLLGMAPLLGCVGDTGDLFMNEATPFEPGAGPAASPSDMPGAAPNDTGGAQPSVSTTTSANEAGLPGSLPVEPGAISAGAGNGSGNGAGAPSNAGSADNAAATGQPAPAEPNPARVCPAIAQPLLLDFASPGNNPEQGLFGDFTPASFSGGTFVYPQVSGTATPVAGDVPGLGLVSDVTTGDWRISGFVSQASGFGIFFNCQLVDASRFVGIAFRVQGLIEARQEIELQLGTASNAVSREWFLARGNTGAATTFGRCSPLESEFDGTCQAARLGIAVPPEGGEVVVSFADLTQGRPEPGINPAEVTTLVWTLPQAAGTDAGAPVPYAVDLRVDDIRFITTIPPEPLPEPAPAEPLPAEPLPPEQLPPEQPSAEPAEPAPADPLPPSGP